MPATLSLIFDRPWRFLHTKLTTKEIIVHRNLNTVAIYIKNRQNSLVLMLKKWLERSDSVRKSNLGLILQLMFAIGLSMDKNLCRPNKSLWIVSYDYLKLRKFTRATKSGEIQDPKFLFCNRLTHCAVNHFSKADNRC